MKRIVLVLFLLMMRTSTLHSSQYKDSPYHFTVVPDVYGVCCAFLPDQSSFDTPSSSFESSCQKQFNVGNVSCSVSPACVAVTLGNY